jgi:hypothetical protein
MKKKERTSTAEKVGVAAGGTAMTAGYVKAARDRQLGKDFIEARRSKIADIKKQIPKKSTFEDIVDESAETSVADARKKRAAERKQLIDDWDVDQAKKHKVIAAQTTKARDGKRVTSGRKGIRGSIIVKNGKAYAKPSKVSQALQLLSGGKAVLPKVFLKRNPFR